MKNLNGDFEYITSDYTIDATLNHPAFKDFKQFLLPLEKFRNVDDMRIDQIELLLPYHNNISVKTTLRALNHIIDEVNNGHKMFLRFYSEQDLMKDTDKESTGLFFFRGEAGAPFAIICAGGAFRYVGSIHEGYPYAMEICKRKYNAFVIQYRIGSGQHATEDLAAAINYIFKNAELLQVSKEDYALWGSSAGAIMAANIGTNGTEIYCGEYLPKPAAIIIAYSSYDKYTASDPPTFSVVGSEDKIERTLAMEHHIEDLLEAGVDAEFHKYPGMKHGFGLGEGTIAEGWVEKAISFWEKHHQ